MKQTFIKNKRIFSQAGGGAGFPLDYKGTWNANLNDPTLTSGVGNAGDYYIVSVAGNTNLDGITDWQISDWAIFNGTVWQKVDNSDAGLVPYTGATQNVDLGEYELKAGQIELDQSPTGTAGVAVTRWNDSLGSTETTLKGGSVILKNGVDLVARVVNKVTPNQTLTKAQYQVVKVSGAQGQRLAIDLAQANNDNNSADTLGVVIETIATNQEGFIMNVGQLEGINTTGNLQGESWADGNVLYLSPTTPGAITNVKPNGSTGHIVVIGYVEHSHAVNGKIYVKIMNGWELDELHNVYINPSTLANNDALIYESATQLWKNKTIATALGFTPENVANKSTSTSLGTSDTLYPTQNAVKVYADNLLGNANALIYKGVLDCSANPNYPAANAGELYIASVAGKIGGALGIDVEVGDMIICNTDGTASGDQATVGAYWNIIQKNIVGAVTGPASSVNNNVAFFDGVTGKVIKDSGITLSGTNTGDQTLSGLGGVPTSRNITINGSTQDLSADRTYTVTDANLSTSDITTNNVSTTKHGFVPKAPNDAKKYLDGTGAWSSLPIEIQVAASDETTALTAGTAKVTFRTPCAMTVTAVRASLTTAQATNGAGGIFTVDINEGGVSILSTKLTIDNTAKTSTTATTPPVISDSALADDAEMTIDIDQIGDGTAKGLKVTIIGTRV